MNNLRKGLRVAAIFAMLAFVSAVPMNAQSNNNGMESGTTSVTTTRTVERDDDSSNWGWIGLLGLLGLAGLIPKKKNDVHRDDNRSTVH